MITAMIAMFALGYLAIALEHNIGINKAPIAVALGVILWIMYMFLGDAEIISANEIDFEHFLSGNPELTAVPIAQQCAKFVTNFQLAEHLGDTVQIVLYLIAAMAIVEMIDIHGGFSVITNRITTKSKRKLLWIVAFITFFMSAVLDNMTSAIVMTMLLRKLVSIKRERWIFAGIIIISANSGGAWTPTGDITTIMLWMAEKLTTINLMKTLFLPSVVSLIVPLSICTFWLNRKPLAAPSITAKQNALSYLNRKAKLSIFLLGIFGLLFIPIFKAITGLPPFMGALLVFAFIWIYIELMYNKLRDIPYQHQHRMSEVLGRIDISTAIFFLGILMAVSALQSAGVLAAASEFLDTNVRNVYVINSIIGIMSSIVDNVPLVAGAMGMYPTLNVEAIATAGDSAYMLNFIEDGVFWQLLAYCAGVGGSILIIGSAAGVVVMGIERITFAWYLKKFSPVVLLGYFAGILVHFIAT